MLISGSDPVAAVLGSALDGLALRQRVAADNVANIDTPGFIASKVDFETSLRTAIADGSLVEDAATGGPEDIPAPTVTPTAATPGANGNNVDLAAEQMTAMRASFQYQLLSRAVGDRYALITTAIGGM
ncbi:MAG TPA: flagellar basal body rod protein FlgB [Nocardioidaceae bacterium]|jgi:flagellar basal-body rod protein FlgB